MAEIYDKSSGQHRLTEHSSRLPIIVIGALIVLAIIIYALTRNG
jgi:hypothetical protein